MKQRKILFISHCFPMNNDDMRGIFFSNIIKKIIQSGAEVGVLSPIWDGVSKLDWDAEDFTFNLKRPFLSEKQHILSKMITLILFYIKIIAVMILHHQQIKKYDHIVFCWGFPSGILALFFKSTRHKTIWWLGTDYYLMRKLLNIYFLILGKGVNHASCSLSISKELERITGTQISHFPIDYAKKDTSEHSVPKEYSDVVDCVAIGRLEPIKQFDDLIRCFSKLDPKKYQLKIIGDGMQYRELELLAECSPNISLLGRLSRQDTLQQLSKSDYLLVCSKHEGLPTVFFEGLDVGTPCISVAVGDIAHLSHAHPQTCYIMKTLCMREIMNGCEVLGGSDRKSFEKSRDTILKEYDSMKTVEALLDF